MEHEASSQRTRRNGEVQEMSQKGKTYTAEEFESSGVELRVSPACRDCSSVMVSIDDGDAFGLTQKFGCPFCGKEIRVRMPQSGDVQ